MEDRPLNGSNTLKALERMFELMSNKAYEKCKVIFIHGASLGLLDASRTGPTALAPGEKAGTNSHGIGKARVASIIVSGRTRPRSLDST